jgi:hypothetical protein
MTRKIDWRHIDEKTFNELVETLLVQEETREGRRAMALDGRGGDGGIDVDVRVEQTNQLTHIYQLKYFPGGMSGGHIARRSQVKKSLSAALKSEPSQGWAWTLVLPSKVTAPERKAVRAMRPGSKPEMRFMGPPELDRLLGLHPEIERRFTADYAVEVLREVHRESAALTRPDDLAAEATRLRDRLDGRSVYWGIAFGVEPDGSVRETVFAKRDDAHEREPLSVNLSLQFGPESEAQRKAFADAMNYGVVEKVELTSEVIQAFQTSGPEWWARDETGGEIHFLPRSENLAEKIVMTTRDPAGRRLRSLHGTVNLIDGGALGVSVAATFPGGMTQVWRLPEDRSSSGEVKFTFDPVGQSPTDVLRVMACMSSVRPDGTVDLQIGGRPAAALIMQPGNGIARSPEFAAALDDLAIIEKECDVRFEVPEDGISNEDRLWARILVRMLHGAATPFPGINGFNFQFSGGQTDDRFADLVERGGVSFVLASEWSRPLLGVDVFPGPVGIYCANAETLAGAAHAAALRDGRGKDRRGSVRAKDGLPYVIYLPDRLTGTGVETVAWGIDGLEEHSGLVAHQVLERQRAKDALTTNEV